MALLFSPGTVSHSPFSFHISYLLVVLVLDRSLIMLIHSLLLYLVTFATTGHSHTISKSSKDTNMVGVSRPALNLDLPWNALNFVMVKRQAAPSTDPCGSSNPCPSPTTISIQCGSSNPCPTGATTETETQLATMTIQTTEMQTAYITDHKTTTQHTLQMVTKTVKEAETTTVTSTVPGCSTVTTTTTSMSLTTTINWVSAPPSSSSGCGGYSCTVTTTKATDVDMPTTAAGKTQISGHDVVEVVSEQEMLKKAAEKERQEDAAMTQPGKLVARQGMRSDGGSMLVGTKRGIETTLETTIAGTRTITRSPSSSSWNLRHRESNILK